MIATIGIDPGQRSGMAVFVGAALVLLRSVQTGQWVAMLNALRAAKRAIAEVTGAPVDSVADIGLVTEAQFLPRVAADDPGLPEGVPDPRRWASMVSVVRNAAAWEMAGIAWGFKQLEQLHSQSWQARYVPRIDPALLRVGGGRGPTKDEMRAARLREAARVVGDRFSIHREILPDEAAATLIGLTAHVDRLGDHLPPALEWARPKAKARKRRT